MLPNMVDLSVFYRYIIFHTSTLASKTGSVGEFNKCGKTPQKRSLFSAQWGISTTFGAQEK
jgi:hypothetical protein